MLMGVSLRLVLVAAGWLSGWWLLWRLPRLARTGGLTAPPRSVSVVIPARDEAHCLGLLLDDLAAQRASVHQIVVVDDDSRDGTGDLARSFAGVTVVTGRTPPDGWTGKPWACHEGVQAVTGEVLVFLDADVRLAPDAVTAVVAEQERRRGLLSVQPHHRPGAFSEQWSAVFNLIATMGIGAASPGRSGRARGAFGPCLVCTADDYHEVGGHAAVRHEIIEDMALARRFADASLPVAVVGGRDVVSYRMYPHGLGQLVEGWAKNLAAGARSLVLGRSLLIALWVTAALVTIQLMGAAVQDPSAGNLAVAAGAYLAFVGQQLVMLGQVGRFRWWVGPAYPLMFVFFVAVFAWSAWLTIVRRKVTWRGRTIALDSRGRSPAGAGEG